MNMSNAHSHVTIGKQVKDLQQKLLASQASEARLREALEYVKNEVVNPPEGLAESFTKQVIIGAIENALSIPPNTAELEGFVSESVESEIDKRFEVVAWVCGGELYLTKEMADSSKRDWSLVANPLYAKKG
jgi:hypothetical protein